MPCFCDSRGYCQDCEHISRSEIYWFNTLVDGEGNSTEWDTDQQNNFIKMLEGSNPFLLDRGAEAIWATIVLRQAYDVADWMAEKGYTYTNPGGIFVAVKKTTCVYRTTPPHGGIGLKENFGVAIRLFPTSTSSQ